MSRILEIKEKQESVLLHTGCEQFVFRSREGLDGLFNIHKGLIKKVLAQGRKIRCLLYSPRYPLNSTSCRVKLASCSSALLCVDDKFIISKNYHSSQEDPVVYVIDFEDILTLELGRAGLRGWFRIEFALEDKKEEVSVIFRAVSGIRHFSNLLDCYWKSRDVYFDNCSPQVTVNDEILRSLSDVRVIKSINKKSVWIKKRKLLGLKKSLISSPLTILVEKRGFIILEKQESVLSARNFSFIPFKNVFGCKIRNVPAMHRFIEGIEICLNRGLCSHTVIFDKDVQKKEAKQLKDIIREISRKNASDSGRRAFSSGKDTRRRSKEKWSV